MTFFFHISKNDFTSKSNRVEKCILPSENTFFENGARLVARRGDKSSRMVDPIESIHP